MNNLKKYDSLELSNNEMISINGGIFGWFVGAVVVLVAFALGNAIGNSKDDCNCQK